MAIPKVGYWIEFGVQSFDRAIVLHVKERTFRGKNKKLALTLPGEDKKMIVAAAPDGAAIWRLSGSLCRIRGKATPEEFRLAKEVEGRVRAAQKRRKQAKVERGAHAAIENDLDGLKPGDFIMIEFRDKSFSKRKFLGWTDSHRIKFLDNNGKQRFTSAKFARKVEE